jgi:hypothetical protein
MLMFKQLLFVWLSLLTISASPITLTWDPVPTITHYGLYYGVASRSYTKALFVDNTVRITIPDLIPQTTYFFAATSLSDAGVESDFSDELQYIHTPQLNLLFSPATGTVLLSWPADWDGYSVQFSDDLVTWQPGVNPSTQVGASWNYSESFLDHPHRFFRLSHPI